MTQLAPERLAPAGNPLPAEHAIGMVAAAAAVRGAAVATSGLIFTAGIALIVWAITPASGVESGAALRAGVAGFALSNLMPISVGGTALTIPPLLLTGFIVALLTSVARHGRYLPRGRAQETLAILVSAGTYGLIVAATTRGLGPPEAIPAGSVWTATALALCAVAAGTVGRESAWRYWWRGVAPVWVQTGARGGAVGLAVLISGGGIAVVASLVAHFGSAVSVAALAAPTWTDGLGLALLGIIYVPNAVVAGAGYITGVGFVVGPGTYSPFRSSIVDLPAMPLLAATPDHSGVSPVGIALMLVPLLAGGLIGWRVVRKLATRQQRTYAAGVASVSAAVGVGALAWIAKGGVGDGRWASMGAPPLLTAGVAFAEIGVVAVALAVFVHAGAVPWRVVEADADEDDRGPDGSAPVGDVMPADDSAVADSSALADDSDLADESAVDDDDDDRGASDVGDPSDSTGASASDPDSEADDDPSGESATEAALCADPAADEGDKPADSDRPEADEIHDTDGAEPADSSTTDDQAPAARDR